MQQYINEIIIQIQKLVSSSPYLLSIILAMVVVALESIMPVLPLGAFIALNMILFGNGVGFLISWIATCLGCVLSYIMVKKFFRNKFQKKFKKNERLMHLLNKINKLSFTSFVLITALPFTPAFAINIAASLADINIKKFTVGIIIAKLFIVYFWGFIGSTFLQSVTDIKSLIKISIMLILAYIISKLVMKKLKLT